MVSSWVSKSCFKVATELLKSPGKDWKRSEAMKGRHKAAGQVAKKKSWTANRIKFNYNSVFYGGSDVAMCSAISHTSTKDRNPLLLLLLFHLLSSEFNRQTYSGILGQKSRIQKCRNGKSLKLKNGATLRKTFEKLFHASMIWYF